MVEKTYELKFYGFGVTRGMCEGPCGDFQPPQKIVFRDGRMRKTEIGVSPPSNFFDAFKDVRIYACPRINGTTCTKDENLLECINPYTISSTAKLATGPIETTVTFCSGDDSLIIKK